MSIKQWWLAEQMGVDRKTVSRWVQGQVRSIQPENAQTLAKILECRTEDLLVGDESQQLASIAQQKQAAEMLLDSSIVEKLGPLGEWNVIESLLKAVIVPGLPENILGELYNQLCVASWRQSKMDQAAIFNQKAQELGHKTGDKEVIAKALLSKANLLSWKGKTLTAVAAYKECLTYEKYIEERVLGAINSNLGAVLYEAGYLQEGKPYLEQALKIFEFHGRPMNLSISWCHMARISILGKNLDLGEEQCRRSVDFAKADDYRRGLQIGKLVQAEIHALKRETSQAMDSLREGLRGFGALNIVEALNFEIAGRVQRICGHYVQSEELLKQGIACGEDYPLYLARIYFEMFQTLLKMPGREDEAHSFEGKARELFQICEAKSN